MREHCAPTMMAEVKKTDQTKCLQGYRGTGTCMEI